MLKIEVNGINYFVKSDISVLEACESLGIDVPRFCYHHTLSVAGNCRICLVEIFNSPKTVASCALPVSNNMKIWVNSPLVKKARENVLEALLINHPLDCPICDQAGECDLQDQSKTFGLDSNRFYFSKRVVEDKNLGPVIKTIMTRCIHCTRCVRFNSEISGYETLGTLGRGSSMEIGSYDNSIYLSDVSGNVIDLCPVGALTSNVFSFSSRPWELKIYESIELSDGIGNTVYLSLKESEIQRVSSKSNYKVKDIFISDRARYYFDYQKTRLNSIYINFKEITKIKNIFNIEILLKSKSKHNNILFLVDNSLDFDSLFYSKTLTNSNKNFFEKKSFSFLIRSTPTNLCSNYYINWLNSPISQFKNNSNNCFLVSSCLKVENVLINSKLFIKKAQHNFLIFGFLLYSQNNLNVEFLNLNLKNMFFYFEGKFFLCKFFINQKFPLFILGENFFRRAICLPFANILLNTINNSSIFLKSQLSINEEGKAILHIFPVTTRSLKISNFLIFADLEDSFFLKKLLFKTKSEVILLGSHKSSLFNNRIKNFIPCTTEYEEEKVFVNLEQRFQKTTKILIPNKKVLTIRNILYLFFNIKKISLYIEFLNVFKEMYINLELFDKKENFLLSHIRRCLLMVFMLSYEKYLISLYPAKLNVEDSYLSNKILKNSKNMQIISQFTRKKSINFL